MVESNEFVPPSNSIDVSLKKDGGILKSIIKEGTGDIPASGCNVTVHYTGKLTDGSVFDSSRERDSPFSFLLGKGKVIKGWDIGVATMKIGEISLLTIREEYAYGKSGSPPKIPPGATLLFEIELIDFEPENLSGKKDKGILRYPIKAGKDFDSPKSMSDVSIYLKGEYNGNIFDERDVNFMLGTGSTIDIPPGVEKAIEHFTLDETSKIIISPKYGFGSVGSKNLKIPPDATLTYYLTLKSFVKVKDLWLMNHEEQLTEAKRLKEKGTEYFKKSDIKLALKMYKNMLQYIDKEICDEADKDKEEERKLILIAAYSNIALCNLKLERQTEAINSCNSVLELDPNNEKALFRRGQAFLAFGEPEKARQDFERVVTLEPNNKAAAASIIQCGQVQKLLKAREKKMYADMFEKFAQKDREWRFGWLQGEKPQVEIAPENPEWALQKKAHFEAKKKFVNDAAKRLEERKRLEQLEKLEQKEQQNEESNEQINKEQIEQQNVEQIEQQNEEQKISEEINSPNLPCKYKANKEEEERKKQPDVMKGCFGEWGADEREREPTDFEKENPDILMLEGSGDFKNM